MANGSGLDKHHAAIRRVALVTQYLDALADPKKGEKAVLAIWHKGVDKKDPQSLVAHNEAQKAARTLLAAPRKPQDALSAWSKTANTELSTAVSKIMESKTSHDESKNTWFELHGKMPAETSVSGVYRSILHKHKPPEKPRFPGK